MRTGGTSTRGTLERNDKSQCATGTGRWGRATGVLRRQRNGECGIHGERGPFASSKAGLVLLQLTGASEERTAWGKGVRDASAGNATRRTGGPRGVVGTEVRGGVGL